jgi:hypothetical protein
MPAFMTPPQPETSPQLTHRIRSCLDSAASHGLTALEAITRALAGDPWLPARLMLQP